jgi:signal peptidase II
LASTQHRHSKWLLALGYFSLFVANVLFDQSTKWHAEKSFLTSSDQHEVRGYRATSQNVLNWGVSPAVVHAQKLARELETSQWADIRFTYVRNPGAAWGSFSKMPASVRLPFFYFVTLFATAVVVAIFWMSHPGNRLLRSGLVLVLAGAAGNFIDRAILNYVIDWIQIHWKILGWEFSFPVFNWADAVITIGFVLWIVEGLGNEILVKRHVKV